MQITIRLSDSCREAWFVANAEELPSRVTLESPDAELSVEDRKTLFAVAELRLGRTLGDGYDAGFYSDVFPVNVTDWTKLIASYRIFVSAEDAKKVAKEQAHRATREKQIAEKIDEINAYLDGRCSIDKWKIHRMQHNGPSSSDEVYEGYARWKAVFDQAVEAQKQYEKQQDDAACAQKVAEEAQTKADAESARIERARWIVAHGSDYLKKSHHAGYNCQRVYVTERAALDYPGYAVDFRDLGEWNNCACPSPEALDEALRVDGRVVWLTEPGADCRKAWGADYEAPSELDENGEPYEGGDDDDDPFTPCEAVVISLLDKYDLVKRF